MRELAPNQRSIDAVDAGGGQRAQYRIRGVKGLVLDVTTRSKTWRLRYRLRRGGKRLERSYKIGDAAIIRVGAAIDEAKRLMEQIERQKGDPAGEERQRRYGTARIETFGDLFSDWLQKAKPRLATWLGEEKRYQLHLQRELGRKPLAEIARDDIARIRDRLFEKGTPIESNRVVALFNRVMNFGVEERHILSNPGHRLRKLGEERARSRHLKEPDLRALWLGLERAPISPAMSDALRLLILLGQRRGEVIGARVPEIQLSVSQPIWTIPAERTKNGHTHLVPLPRMRRKSLRGP